MFGARVLAVIVAAVVAATPLAGTHVHAYVDHDHPEHDHGPAVHGHERRGHDVPGAKAHSRLSACDPADHELALQAACGAVTCLHVAMPAVLGNGAIQRPASSHVSIRLTDVRVHGPPGRRAAPPRAPPVVHPA